MVSITRLSPSMVDLSSQSRLRRLLSMLLGLVIVCSLLMIAGYGRPGSRLGGVPLGQPLRVEPAESWTAGLRRLAAENGLEDFQVQPWGEYRSSQRAHEAFYRATLQGVRDGEPVTVKVELRAPHGGAWRLKEWSEQ